MKLLRDDRGQSTSEYILIVVLVVIAVVISLHFFGETVKDKFFTSGKKIETSTDSPGQSPGEPGSGQSSGSGSYSTSSGQKPGAMRPGASDMDMAPPELFGNEEALKSYEEEKQKAWLKTILVFAVAGAILLMLVFMTLERIRMLKKQLRMQQDMDDFKRGSRSRPITFKRPFKPGD